VTGLYGGGPPYPAAPRSITRNHCTEKSSLYGPNGRERAATTPTTVVAPIATQNAQR